jgi:hypothetical protein
MDSSHGAASAIALDFYPMTGEIPRNSLFG